MPSSTSGLDKGQIVNGYAVNGDANDATVGIIPVGGQDGANRREFLTDAGGRQVQLLSDGTTTLPVAVEAAAAKTAGIQLMGDDGTNAKNVSVDANGRVNTNAIVNEAEEIAEYGSSAIVTGSFTTVKSYTPGADTSTTKIYVSATDATIFQVKYGTTGAEAVIAYFQTSGSGLNEIIPLRLSITTLQTIIVEAKGTKSGITAHATILHE